MDLDLKRTAQIKLPFRYRSSSLISLQQLNIRKLLYPRHWFVTTLPKMRTGNEVKTVEIFVFLAKHTTLSVNDLIIENISLIALKFAL